MLKTFTTVLCFGLSLTFFVCPAMARKWTDKTGKFSVEADFVT